MDKSGGRRGAEPRALFRREEGDAIFGVGATLSVAHTQNSNDGEHRRQLTKSVVQGGNELIALNATHKRHLIYNACNAFFIFVTSGLRTVPTRIPFVKLAQLGRKSEK